MVLESLLSQKTAAILERWFQLILETYPADTSRFLKQENDRFVNPVGYMTSREIEVLYEELLRGVNSDKVAVSLDNIIRIRSVQDFFPSQAIAFIFLLKKAIRQELETEIRENQLFDELLRFESRIDVYPPTILSRSLAHSGELLPIRIKPTPPVVKPARKNSTNHRKNLSRNRR